jgi:hypothetical protein
VEMVYLSSVSRRRPSMSKRQARMGGKLGKVRVRYERMRRVLGGYVRGRKMWEGVEEQVRCERGVRRKSGELTLALW